MDFGVIVIEEVFVGVLEVVGNEKGGVVIKGFLMGCIGGVILLGFEDVDNVVVFIRVWFFFVMVIEFFLFEVFIFEWFILEFILVLRFELFKKYMKFFVCSF